jgi:hypothetical protein
MDLLNLDQSILSLKNFVTDWMAVNPYSTAILTFLVGWLMKRAPWFESIVKGFAGWWIGVKK